jgi:hypothetical protein
MTCKFKPHKKWDWKNEEFLNEKCVICGYPAKFHMGYHMTHDLVFDSKSPFALIIEETPNKTN